MMIMSSGSWMVEYMAIAHKCETPGGSSCLMASFETMS